MAQRVAKKKRKKFDHQKEMTQYLTKASISLGAALYHARVLGDTDLAADILKAAIQSEKIESKVVGKTIDRLKEGQ